MNLWEHILFFHCIFPTTCCNKAPSFESTMVCRIMVAGTKLYCCESKLQRQLNCTTMQSKLQLQASKDTWFQKCPPTCTRQFQNLYWQWTMDQRLESRVNPHMAAHSVENRRKQNTTLEDASNSTHEQDQDAPRQTLAERPEDAKLNS